MKKTLISTALLLLFSTLIYAQAPYSFNYQGVARGTDGQPLADQNIGLRISVVDGASVVYQETQSVTTNDFGLFTAIIGEGDVVSGSLSTYETASPLSLQIEMDPDGGTNYEDLGTTELQSVPYANTANALVGTNAGGIGIISNGSSALYTRLIEGGNVRGYIGSFAEAAQDVDFGTSTTNTTGALHLTIQTVPVLTIDENFRTGIGTTEPFTDFQISHGISSGVNKGLTMENLGGSAPTNSWTFYTQGSSGNLLVYTGTIPRGVFNRSTGIYSTVSDRRLKTNISNQKPVLEQVMNIRPVQYNFKTDPNDPKVLGVIAQELQAQFPELVTTLRGDGIGEYEELLTVDYSGLGVIAIKAIQEQQAIIEALKEELASLKAQVAELQN